MLSASAMAPSTMAPAYPAGRVSVGYRETADHFELLDQVSAWWPDYVEPAYRQAWMTRGLARPGDSAVFAAYARLRARHVDRTGQGGRDAAAWRADSTGPGLFSAGAGRTADPVAAAFYAAASVDDALARLTGVLTRDEVAFLRGFYRRFAPRVDPLLAETRARVAPSRAATAATLADPAVVAYLAQVAGLFASVEPVGAARRDTAGRDTAGRHITGAS